VAEPVPAPVPGRDLGAAGGRPTDRVRPPVVEDSMSRPAQDATIAGPIDVALADVEPELSRLAHDAAGPCEAPVPRARMSNLIVHCRFSERAEEVEPLLPEIVAIHPARVLFLIADARSDSPDIHASALVRKAGQQAQLCSEQ